MTSTSHSPSQNNSAAQQRLRDLRDELARQGLDGFIVPRADEHQGENVPPSAERLAWLSGFTGSAGLCVVLAEKAAVFVDGRYTLQVRDEVPDDLYEYRHLISEPASDWIAAELPKGGKLGFDAWLMTPNQVTRYRKAAEKAGGTLVAVERNPLDTVWRDQPEPPRAQVAAHDLAYTGRSSDEKRAQAAAELKKNAQAAVVLSAPDSIAWLLNVRGGDLEFSPHPLSFALLFDDGRVDWFVDPAKPAPDLGEHLGNAVVVHGPDDFGPALDALGQSGACVRLNGDSEPEWVAQRLRDSGAKIVMAPDPCALPRAIKTTAELDGMRAAHMRDGVALVRFLAWLDHESTARTLSEIEVSNQLEALRREDARCKGLSFPTIAGAGPNGAIVHYRASEQSDRALEPGSLFLLDSGAQYLDGTTDVTRTIAIGGPDHPPSDEMRDNFTRVLQGHISLATACFPSGTTGSQLDPFARRALWQAGLDYDHGTGHGVGSYLHVHEGPHRISKSPSAIALEPGMVVSNEPGYYKTGAYGIRIENLVAVRELPVIEGGERTMLGFETLTQAPIDRRLINTALMSADELAWLNVYHAWVASNLIPLLDVASSNWLNAATAPITA